MDLTEVMRTTFAAREFTDDPVSDEQLYRILDSARFAPSGGNRQGWRVSVGRDQAKRRELVDQSMPIGKSGKQLTQLKRFPVGGFTTLDRIDAPPLGG